MYLLCKRSLLHYTSWEGGWMNKFVPKPGADPIKLVGRGLVLSE